MCTGECADFTVVIHVKRSRELTRTNRSPTVRLYEILYHPRSRMFSSNEGLFPVAWLMRPMLFPTYLQRHPRAVLMIRQSDILG